MRKVSYWNRDALRNHVSDLERYLEYINNLNHIRSIEDKLNRIEEMMSALCNSLIERGTMKSDQIKKNADTEAMVISWRDMSN